MQSTANGEDRSGNGDMGDVNVANDSIEKRLSRRAFVKTTLGAVAAASGLGAAGSALGAASGAMRPSLATTNKSKTLQALWLGASWGSAAKIMAAQYEKETGVKVNIQLVDRDAIHSKLVLSVAGKAPYDIFNIDYSWIPEFGAGQQLLSIGQMAKKMGVQLNEFIPRGLACGMYDGHPGHWNTGGTLYGLPQTIHPQILWYRKDIYGDRTMQKNYHSATGKTLKPPTTMNEWHQQVRFFQGKTFKGQKIYGWADQAAKGFGNVHTWLMFLYSFGAEPYDWSTLKPTLTSKSAIAGTKLWAEMMKYTPPGINSWVFPQVMAAASGGQLATVLMWSWAAYSLEQPNSPTKGKWGFVEVPAGTVHGVSHLGSWVDVIPKTAKDPETAFHFLAWLHNKKNTIKQAMLNGDNYGGDPTRLDAYQSRALVTSNIPGTNIHQFTRFPVTLRAMEHTRPRPFFPKEEAWEVAITGDLSALQLGQTSVESALKSANAHAAAVTAGMAKYVPQPGPNFPQPKAAVSLASLANQLQSELR